MKRNALFSFIFSLLLLWPLGSFNSLQAQGGGQGQHGQSTKKGSMEQGKKKGTAAQQRQKIHATQQQQDRFRDCDATMQRLRDQAGSLSKYGKGSDFDIAEARRQGEELKEQMKEMFRRQEAFRESLTEQQREQFQKRLKEQDRNEERLQVRMRDLDSVLADSQPNPTRVRSRARELEKSLKKCHQELRSLGSEMGIPEKT